MITSQMFHSYASSYPRTARTDTTPTAIAAGQQLYLHTVYDDGWSMCEDQNQARGVVPISCLEPWQENLEAIPR